MPRKAMLVTGLAALMLLPAASANTQATGLKGTVTLSPIRPVCIEDEPCSKPAAGVVLRFARDGRIVGRVTTKGDGSYRIVLGRGTYVVSFAPRPAPRQITPVRVRVVAGQMTRVDFDISTGLQ